jgi:quercetin dioxygenase-like cupin family protein
MYTDLETFKDWWWNNRPFCVPQENILSHVADLKGIVLFRDGEYQVELFIMSPNSIISSHIHPNVDSFEVYIGGDITFECNGQPRINNKPGDSMRVLPSSYHGGYIGERGGCFLSIQRWLNNATPKFIGDDWDDHNCHKSYGETQPPKP